MKVSKALVIDLFYNLNNEGIDTDSELEWVFEFSHIDSVYLQTVLDHYANTSSTIRLDTIRLATTEDNTSSKTYAGLYLADIIETGKNTQESLFKRLKELQNIFKKSLINLSGVGVIIQNTHNVESHPPQIVNKNNININKAFGVVRTLNDIPIPYVSIGLVNSNTGTVSGEDGKFSLEIPNNVSTDSIGFFCVGYKELRLPLSQLTKKSISIYLEEEIIQLDEVVVTESRLSKKVILGSKRSGNQFGFVQGKGAGAEAARLMDPKNKNIFLNKAGIFVLNKKESSFKLMLNVYSLDPLSGLPDKNLLRKPIQVIGEIKKGWLEVDLSSHSIVMSEPFFISFQWIDSNSKHPRIGLGGSKAFVRPTSFGKWLTTRDFNWAIRLEASIID